MRKVKHLLAEVLLLCVVILLASFGAHYLTDQVVKAAKAVSLRGTVEKKEIKILSPVFGEIQSLPVYEGEPVTKGQVLAILTIITDNKLNIPDLSHSDIYTLINQKITITAPEDGVVSQVFTAVKGTVAPVGPLLSIYPSSEVSVYLAVPEGDSLGNLTDFRINQDGVNAPLFLATNDLPTRGTSTGDRIAFFRFQNSSQSRDFYNGQPVMIVAQRKNGPGENYLSLVSTFLNHNLAMLKSSLTSLSVEGAK